MKNKKRKKLKIWHVGVGMIVIASFLKGIFFINEMSGFWFDGMYLFIIVGFFIFVFGVTRPKKYD